MRVEERERQKRRLESRVEIKGVPSREGMKSWTKLSPVCSANTLTWTAGHLRVPDDHYNSMRTVETVFNQKCDTEPIHPVQG